MLGEIQRARARKKRGGLKVHMLIDAHSQTPTFVKISEAKLHDKNFIQYLNLPAFSMIVFDRVATHEKSNEIWANFRLFLENRKSLNAFIIKNIPAIG